MQLAQRSAQPLGFTGQKKIEITSPFYPILTSLVLPFDGKIAFAPVQFALSSNHSPLSLGESFPAAESQSVPRVQVIVREA